MQRLRGRYLATMTEWARVARELHDSLLQGMSGALLHLRAIGKRFAPDAPPTARRTVAAEIETAEAMVATNIEETRRCVWNLREDARAAGDLASALEELVARATRGPSVAALIAIRRGLVRLG